MKSATALYLTVGGRNFSGSVNMNRGFIKSILYYLMGLGLAGLSYLAVGHEYIHAPGLHHIIILLTFIGGLLWFVVAAVQYLVGQRTEKSRGVIVTNLVMSVGFSLFMAYILHDVTDPSEPEQNADKVLIEKSGDTTTMYHGASPVYMKVKDSVLINFIDSTKIKWNEVERRGK